MLKEILTFTECKLRKFYTYRILTYHTYWKAPPPLYTPDFVAGTRKHCRSKSPFLLKRSDTWMSILQTPRHT
jgi:hypothetical protein